MTKVLAIIIAAAALTACGESTTPLPAPIATTASIGAIQVSASTINLVVGDSVKVQASAKATDGSPFPLSTVVWTSSDVAIATVRATGPTSAEVRTISTGAVSITATVDSHSGQVALAATTLTTPLETSPWLAFMWSRETGMMPLTFPADAGGSSASDINDLGQVVGSVFLGSELHAFVWTLDHGMTDIGSLPGRPVRYASATAINNAGQVVGGSMDANGHIRAFRWSPSDGMIELPMPSGTQDSRARGINASGQVVGVREDGSGAEIPFRWSLASGTEDLQLWPDTHGAALAIADNGDVVGYSGSRAVLWSADGTSKIIAACAGGLSWDEQYIECYASANAINGSGQIAGNSDTQGSALPFRLTLGANRQDIAPIPGSQLSYAAAINVAGQVVGSSFWNIPQAGQLGRAFLWSPAGGTIDLGSLPGRQWSTATSINNRGQVVGSSY